MRRLYLLLALTLMTSGGYLLYKGKDVGAALVGAGVTAVTIQQVEDHKQRERLDRQRQRNQLEGQENRLTGYLVDNLRQQIDELKTENNILKSKIEEQNAEILELEKNKAKLETRLEYTDDPYYMRAKLDNPALPESDLEEFNTSQYQAEQAEYNEIEVDEEDANNVWENNIK